MAIAIFRGLGVWLLWMTVTFGINGAPLEIQRQFSRRANKDATHGWLTYPDAYMYLVAVCVATIATALIDRPIKIRVIPSALRYIVVVVDLFVITVASANYGATLAPKLDSLKLVDVIYLEWLMVIAIACATVVVLPDRIAEFLSPAPKKAV